MLSVLIPIYNHSIVELVTDLAHQAIQLSVEVEILCLDDGSTDAWKGVNRRIEEVNAFQYEELPNNVGRSKIRNLLAARASQPYLLFLDGDSAIAQNDFLGKYLANLTPDEVVVGGRLYPNIWQNNDQKLHWLAGRYREQRLTSGFQSNNFLIAADKFATVGGFDETLQGYGHEDTLFGLRLEQSGVCIRHIDNPVLHSDLKNALDFMHDQEEAIKNLYRLKMRFPELKTSLLQSAVALKNLGLTPIVSFLFKIGGRQLRGILTGSFPNLLLLDLYKIGFYLTLGLQNKPSGD